MAKSIRSKSKRKFRTIKRQAVFAPVEDKRTEEVAARASVGKPMDPPPTMLKEMKHATDTMDIEPESMGKIEKQRLFLSRNQFKKKQRIARSKSKVRRLPNKRI